jgi:hypothetical protein
MLRIMQLIGGPTAAKISNERDGGKQTALLHS